MSEPDQGLRYELAGVVGAPPALEEMARAHPAARVVPLDHPGIALLPVVPELAADVVPAALCGLGLPTLPGASPPAARHRAEILTGPESGFTVLTAGVVALIEAGSMIAPLAYIEADYLGRDGRQAAAVWRQGRLVTGPLLLGRREVFSPETAPISTALRMLGVPARGRRDQFVLAGLGRHRRTTEWLSRTPRPPERRKEQP